MSVISRRGGPPCLRKRRFSKRLAAFGVAGGLHDLIKHIAVLINRPPQPVLLVGDRDHDLVQMPDVAPARCLAPEAASVRGPNVRAQRRTVS